MPEVTQTLRTGVVTYWLPIMGGIWVPESGSTSVHRMPRHRGEQGPQPRVQDAGTPPPPELRSTPLPAKCRPDSVTCVSDAVCLWEPQPPDCSAGVPGTTCSGGATAGRLVQRESSAWMPVRETPGPTRPARGSRPPHSEAETLDVGNLSHGADKWVSNVITDGDSDTGHTFNLHTGVCRDGSPGGRGTGGGIGVAPVLGSASRFAARWPRASPGLDHL